MKVNCQHTDSYSQRPTTTSETKTVPILNNASHNRYANEYNEQFENYLSGKVSCLDVIKLNNLLVTKRFQNTQVIIHKRNIQPRIIKHFTKEIVDYQEVKEFISNNDKEYSEILEASRLPTEMTQSKRLRQPIQSEYEKEKRIDHFNLIANSFRERILSNNLVTLSVSSNCSNNKVRMRSKQLHIIRPQHDPNIVTKIQQTKQDIHRNQINLRAKSDNLLSSRKQSLQDFQIYQGYNRNSEKQKNNKQQVLNSFRVKRNEIKSGHEKLNIEQDDESVISETEAKLNGLYGQSRKLQKMVLKKKENPSRIIQFISKIEQIKESINKVNSAKLKQKFLI